MLVGPQELQDCIPLSLLLIGATMAPSDDTIAGVMGMLRSIQGDLRAHAAEVLGVKEQIATLLAALGGESGLIQHRLFHERQHTAAAFWEEVRKDAIKSLARAGLWAIFVAAAFLLLKGVLVWLQIQLGIK